MFLAVQMKEQVLNKIHRHVYDLSPNKISRPSYSAVLVIRHQTGS